MAPQTEPVRIDETQKRLLDWSYGQPPSERLAAQLLDAEGYEDIDPSHPLGGPDGGRDGHCTRDGENGVWAVYFPRGQQSFKEIEDKLRADIEAARKHAPKFIAFVTNQEIRLSERAVLREHGDEIKIEVFHLERVAGVLDRAHMAQIRQQFLGIPAVGVAPMDISVVVDGVAHAFTDDTDVADVFVAMREDRIRKRSEEGHERVRKEQAAAARERAARDAARAKEARDRPWAAGLDIPGISDMIGTSSLMDALLPKAAISPETFRIAGYEPPKPPEPLSEEQIQTKVTRYRNELEGRWPACRDYLSSVAFPALRLRIANNAEAFLTDVEVMVTFQGARGVVFKGLNAYKLMRVQDPDWEPPSDPRFPTAYVPPMSFAPPADYPISWRHNDDGDLVVIVTLLRLRPYPEWRSEHYGDDLVLVVDPKLSADEVTVSYTVTASGYGKHLVGESFTVPIQRESMYEVLKAADAAARENS